MYVVDNAGHPKIMMEFEGTANWNGLVTAQTASPSLRIAYVVATFALIDGLRPRWHCDRAQA